MLYNLFCKVITHPMFDLNKAAAIRIVLLFSRLPSNLKQYYADQLHYMVIRSN